MCACAGLGRDYFWDTECVCKAKRVPKRASAMVVLVAKTPRRRYYVGDAIPVEFEIRNHTMKLIKEVAMSLCYVTYGAVMGYSPDDKVRAFTAIAIARADALRHRSL
jgi:hypothetical protein